MHPSLFGNCWYKGGFLQKRFLYFFFLRRISHLSLDLDTSHYGFEKVSLLKPQTLPIAADNTH